MNNWYERAKEVTLCIGHKMADDNTTTYKAAVAGLEFILDKRYETGTGGVVAAERLRVMAQQETIYDSYGQMDVPDRIWKVVNDLYDDFNR